MASVIINPGSGPVSGATRERAELTMGHFIEDLGLGDVAVEFVSECHDTRFNAETQQFEDGPPDGRYEFVLRQNGRETRVQMPGLFVGQVRFMGEDDQNIWDFPRLYVDGSSWVWLYAVPSARDALTGADDEDDE